jgi:hypothetical protein
VGRRGVRGGNEVLPNKYKKKKEECNNWWNTKEK